MSPYLVRRKFRAAAVLLLTFAPCFAIAEGPYRGVNISGAEINAGTLPGRVNFDYVYPTSAQLRLFAGYGMNAVRVPVLWERLQPELGRLSMPLS